MKIGDKETNHFIANTLNSLPWRNNGVWIGLHDNTREMKFEWVTENACEYIFVYMCAFELIKWHFL